MRAPRKHLAAFAAAILAAGVAGCGGVGTSGEGAAPTAAAPTTTSTVTVASAPATTTSDPAAVTTPATTTTAEPQAISATGATTAQATTVPATTAAATETVPATTTTTAAPATTTAAVAAAPTTTTSAATAPVTGSSGFAAASADVTGVSTATLASTPQSTTALTRFFRSNSPWNTQVTGQPVDPGSDRMLRLAHLRTAVVEDPDGTLRPIKRAIGVGLTINVSRWTDPVFGDIGGEPTVAQCRQVDCGPDAVTSISIPTSAAPDPRFDGWMTTIDTGERVARDFWRARREPNGTISYHYVKAWNLDGRGYQAPGGVSARGSGLPLFAGLITPQEIKSGVIDHALAISVPGAASRRYVQPASRTDGNGDPRSLPEGARIRLRPGAVDLLTHKFVRNGRERRAADTVIAALQRYGAIVVDRSAAPTLYAQRNADWRNTLPLNVLQDIHLKDFEVMRLGRILRDPPRAQPELAPSGLPQDGPSSIPATGSGVEVTP